MPLAVLSGVSQQVVRPQRRTRWIGEVRVRPRPQGGDDVSMHPAVVGDDITDRAAVPAPVQHAVLLVDRSAAQRGIVLLAAQGTQLVLLPRNDVCERVLSGPALAFDACACAETRHPLVQPRAQPTHDTIERAVLGLDAGDGPAAGVADRNATRGDRLHDGDVIHASARRAVHESGLRHNGPMSKTVQAV